MLIDKIRINLRYAEEAGEDIGAVLEFDAVQMAQALIAVDDVLKDIEGEDDPFFTPAARKIRKAIESTKQEKDDG